MPREYRGKPSKGCEPCRARRIKCDESKPTCQKCAKTGNDCQYRNLLNLTFRNENTKVAVKAQKTWRQRSKLGDTPEFELSMSPSPNSTPSPGPLIPIDIHETALNRWFYDYSIPADNLHPHRGIMDYLPGIYNKSSSPSALHASVSAVAYANFYRRSGMCSNEGLLIARAFYGEALSLVSKATRDASIARSDEVIMAVHTLGIYEVMSTGGHNTGFWEAHTQGLATLLKLRPVPQPEDGYQFRLFHTINMQMLSASLRLGRESYLPLHMLQDYYTSSHFPMVKLTGLMHHGVNLLAKIGKRAAAKLADLPKETQLTFQQIVLLDVELAYWESNLPLFFHFERYPTLEFRPPLWLKDVMAHSGSPSVMHIYDSLQTAHGWNLYRVLRIMLNRTIVLIQNCDNHNQADRTSSMVLLKRLINEICESVLSHFLVPLPGKPTAMLEEDVCGIRPHLIVAPLTVALDYLRTFPNHLDIRSRAEWVESVLAFISGTFHRRGK